MQDRYAGDLGDFLKLGLLRWLCDAPDGPAMRLGVVWYRVPDETHNADGKHVAYLQSNNRSSSELRRLDPDLYARLANVVASGSRTVVALEAAGVLPAESRTFAETLSLSDLPPMDRVARTLRRREWLQRALTKTENCDVVFFDPDNGIRTSKHAVPAHRNRSIKHAYISELAQFAGRGQSIVVYHHADRNGTVDVQAVKRMQDLTSELSRSSLAAVRASRGSSRLFLVAPAPQHESQIRVRLEALEASEWSRELRVYWA